MSIWKKIKNYLADLYYWRTERKLVLNANAKLREELELAESRKEELIGSYEVRHAKQDECIEALVKENEGLSKLVDELTDELLHQRDVNACLWEDWGKKQAECAVATKKLQDKDEAEYRLWAEHHILLATLLVTEPEEAAKYHV
ncbi:MAG: hypothetical protein E7316_02425 [Clostridiales bacterium]|nr:hypothetical protein [Clostridiales bacterium]